MGGATPQRLAVAGADPARHARAAFRVAARFLRVALAELYEGVYYSTNPEGDKKALDNFLTGVSILGLDDEICKVFGKERGKLRKLKIAIGDFDLLIAATCLCYNLILLTNNIRHFKMVEGLNIVSLK